MTKKYLYGSILKHKSLGRVSFHTPGHKNVPLIIPKDIFTLDFTELPDTDSLYTASNSILKAEEEASKVFETKRTAFSAGGCTLCIQAMIRLVSKGKKKIIVGRTLHQSAINTIALLNLEPEYIMPRVDCGECLPGRIHPDDVKTALSKVPEASAVYITSPDYFGVMCDIEEISKKCKERNVPLIIDNAHGTHLKFLQKDLHPITLGASMSADSAHKTLPVLTGGAFLQINDDKFSNEAKSAMSLFGSTSPSYPIMASLDLCQSWLSEHAKREFSITHNYVDHFFESIKKSGINPIKGLCDPIRISICTKDVGISGRQAAEFFRKNGIEPEYADNNYVVMIPTPMNSEMDFGKLENITSMLIVKFGTEKEKTVNYLRLRSLPKKCMTPHEALFSNNEFVNINEALDRVCSEVVCPCPPGVPVVMPGELVSYEIVEILKRYGILNLKVVK